MEINILYKKFINRIFYYTTFILLILIFELIFKVKIKNDLVENESIYKNLWIIGIIGFILGTLIIPFLNKIDFLWNFF